MKNTTAAKINAFANIVRVHAAQQDSVLSACGMTHVAQTPLLGDVTCPECLDAMVKKMAAVETPKQKITREEIMMHPDGTWIMTNHEMTKILDFAKWSEPKPSGFLNGFWWRRKQLLDELGMGA